MKIIYHIGNEVTADTVVKKGILNDDKQQMFIESVGEKYIFNEIKQVNVVKINYLGTMVKVINGEDTIFLAVPRIFIDKGTGFAIINFFATKKAANLLSCSMLNQKNK